MLELAPLNQITQSIWPCKFTCCQQNHCCQSSLHLSLVSFSTFFTPSVLPPQLLDNSIFGRVLESKTSKSTPVSATMKLIIFFLWKWSKNQRSFSLLFLYNSRNALLNRSADSRNCSPVLTDPSMKDWSTCFKAGWPICLVINGVSILLLAFSNADSTQVYNAAWVFGRIGIWPDLLAWEFPAPFLPSGATRPFRFY